MGKDYYLVSETTENSPQATVELRENIDFENSDTLDFSDASFGVIREKIAQTRQSS
ncbi:MAG: hypothetical protein ACFB8W_18940 [Elainellaceae cyanobacterium]